MAQAVEPLKRTGFAIFQDNSRPRHPVSALTMDQVTDDIECTPSIRAFILVSPASCLADPITQFTLGGHDLFWPTLSTVDGAQVKRRNEKCQCRFSVQYEFIRGELWLLQLIAVKRLANHENN